MTRFSGPSNGSQLQAQWSIYWRKKIITNNIWPREREILEIEPKSLISKGYGAKQSEKNKGRRIPRRILSLSLVGESASVVNSRYPCVVSKTNGRFLQLKFRGRLPPPLLYSPANTICGTGWYTHTHTRATYTILGCSVHIITAQTNVQSIKLVDKSMKCILQETGSSLSAPFNLPPPPPRTGQLFLWRRQRKNKRKPIDGNELNEEGWRGRIFFPPPWRPNEYRERQRGGANF